MTRIRAANIDPRGDFACAAGMSAVENLTPESTHEAMGDARSEPAGDQVRW